MPRDFYGHRTVTDYLIAQGVHFDPQTVVMDCDEVDESGPPISYEASLLGRCRPPFEFQTLEAIRNHNNLGKVGRLAYVIFEPELHLMSVLAFRVTPEHIFSAKGLATCKLTEDGYLSGEDAKLTSWSSGLTVFNDSEVLPLLPPHDVQVDIVFSVMVFNLIHDKYEIDEVEFPRQARRATERKTGKKPSNYYSIRNIKRQRKQYPVSDSTSSAASSRTKAEAHLVRGHFLTQPDNHPLPQFAGKTFWIPAHNRGAGTNEKKIIYRVEL